MVADIEEGVWVESLRVFGDVCNAEIQEKYEEQEWDCYEGLRRCGWDDYLQQSIDGIQGVLGYLRNRRVSAAINVA